MSNYKGRKYDMENSKMRREVIARGRRIASGDFDEDERLANKLGKKWRVRRLAEYKWQGDKHSHTPYYG
jgi:glycerol-3-phosphate cytidylyltransferase-like family protein